MHFPLNLKSLDFLISRLTAPPNGRPCHISKLSHDTLVDQVFIYLDVFDILRLRLVNKLYYYLTHHTAIWKRFLRNAEVPLPPLPPTSRYSLQNINGLEAERVVLRGVSLEERWKNNDLNYMQSWEFYAHHHILSMAMLPGGHYIVASVTDNARSRYSLIIFVMDSTLAGAWVVARTDTFTKAYHLQAKYMTIGGERGIVVAYIRRNYRRFEDMQSGVDISQYSADHEIDSPVPIKYECVCLHVPLSSLEVLGDSRIVPGSEEYLRHARAQPAPFRPLATVQTRSPLGIPCLDEIFGSPYLAVAKDRNKIVFKKLDGGPAATLHCEPTFVGPIEEHSIAAIRLVSVENKVLVVRKVSQGDPTVTVEYYDVIPPGDEKAEVHASCTNGIIIYGADATWVKISDHGIPPREDDSVVPVLYGRPEAYAPRPISVFIYLSAGRKLLRLSIFPVRDEDVPLPSPSSGPLSHDQAYGAYTYPLKADKEPDWWSFKRYEEEAHVLAGSYRSIVYTTPLGNRTDAPPIVKFHRYFDPWSRWEDPPDGVDMHQKHVVSRTYVPDSVRDIKSVAALAWDETIGRLCVAGAGSPTVHVLDFAAWPVSRETSGGTVRRPVAVQLNPDPDAILAPLPELPPEEDGETESMAVDAA
ncbi:hypothetical protein BKA93DRAFT_828413 [Sparassis latifolia]